MGRRMLQGKRILGTDHFWVSEKVQNVFPAEVGVEGKCFLKLGTE